MRQADWVKQGTKVGVFLVILFIICFVWLYLRGGSPEIRILHNNLLVLSFFGFSGVNLSSFIAGAVQSFIWGYVAVALWRLAGFIVKE